jgi:hypothetical protein
LGFSDDEATQSVPADPMTLGNSENGVRSLFV